MSTYMYFLMQVFDGSLFTIVLVQDICLTFKSIHADLKYDWEGLNSLNSLAVVTQHLKKEILCLWTWMAEGGRYLCAF